MTNFRLHDEQTVNGLRKIAWASVFLLKRQHIYIDVYIEIYIYISICLSLSISSLYLYLYLYISIYMLPFQYISIYTKTEVCVPWSVNDKR
jgi:hypothetical protein